MTKLLDLGRAFVETKQTYIAVKALDLIFIDIGRPSVYLDSSVGNAAHRLGSEHLGTRRLHAHFGVAGTAGFGVIAVCYGLH